MARPHLKLLHHAPERDPSLDDPFLRKVARTVAATPIAPRAGMRVGGEEGTRFELLEPLAHGALVFRARDELLDREVALKFAAVVDSAGERDPEEAAERLLAEARIAARVDHANVVRVHDVDHWQGLPFLVMECLGGVRLDVLLAEERIAPRRAAEITCGLAAALEHLHARGIVHRDVKPSNIIVDADGRVKLLDLGLAAVGPVREVSGTPHYMAPEQWRGRPQDARTDLWAAGCVLHELLTGRTVYPEDDAERLAARVTSFYDPPPTLLAAEHLPPGAARVLARTLAKDPEDRYATAAELETAARRLVDAVGLPVGESLAS